MPHAVTHFLIPVILLELFRHFFVKDKESFPIHYVFIGGLAGLLPDFDMIPYFILGLFGFSIQGIHRTFTHNLFFPSLFLICAGFFHNFKNKWLGKYHLHLEDIFLVIAFGVFIHILLDAIVCGAILPFYPFSEFSFGLNLVKMVPESLQESILPTIDAVLLILWMVSLEIRHKISEFI